MKKMISFILAFTCIMSLVGCVQSEPTNNEARQLTSVEIEKVNKAFEALLPIESEEYDNMINPSINFFTSYYEKPQDMNFEKFLMYFGTENMLDQAEVSNDEFLMLREQSNFSFDKTQTFDTMPVPTHRKPIDEVNAVLKKYMGITTEDLDVEDIPFLGEPYNAFYNHTSDAGFPVFTCISGEIKGDIVTLYSEHHTLTLHKENDNYYIYSYLKNEWYDLKWLAYYIIFSNAYGRKTKLISTTTIYIDKTAE